MNSLAIFARWAASLTFLLASEVSYQLDESVYEAWLQEAHAHRDYALAAEQGALWLVAHQHPEGHWDCDGFGAQCPHEKCTGYGQENHDVGVTGLALMALMTRPTAETQDGDCEAVDGAIEKGVQWLLSQRDPNTGRVGTHLTFTSVYDHAVATVALAQAYGAHPNAELGNACLRAVDFILSNQSPDAGWRYEVPPDGSSDTSVTAWMIHALDAAFSAGLEVEAEASFQRAHRFLRAMTDGPTGRVGYTEPGSASSRVVGCNDQYPTEKGEALTAAALVAASMMGLDLHEPGEPNRSVRLLLLTLPEYSQDGYSNDYLYWYYGTEALHRMRGTHPKEWARWSASMGAALSESQESAGHSSGSWKPDGPWGHVGGRVTSTALSILTLSRLQ